MFHKRLLKEFNDNMKYVIGMAATQWVSLLANVGMMLTMAVFVANLVTVFANNSQVEIAGGSASNFKKV